MDAVSAAARRDIGRGMKENIVNRVCRRGVWNHFEVRGKNNSGKFLKVWGNGRIP
jgi:hypothetical protein